MKRLFFIILLGHISFVCNGQTLFYSKPNKSIWLSETEVTVNSLLRETNLALLKPRYPLDSIKKDFTILAFQDDTLKIVKHFTKQNKDSLIGRFKFDFDSTEFQLNIYINNEKLKFKIAFVSTGSYATLYRRKEKKVK